MKFWLAILLLFLTSCVLETSTTEPDSSDDIITLPGLIPIYEGFDIEGEAAECDVPLYDLVCTEEYGPDEEFRTACLKNGHEVFVCGCHQYLCSENVNEEVTARKTGYDIDGRERSCEIQKEKIVCTQEFTQEDAFALDCEKNGGEAIQCGCHDWICVD